MQRRKLGQLDVSAMGLGCATMTPFYGEPDPAEAIATIRRAPELGIDLLDTSDAYGNGRNEELISGAIEGRRSEYIIASKFGNLRRPDGTPTADGRPEYFRLACERSLRRLRTEFIDLYYIHRLDPAVPIEGTVGAMSTLVREGKVRFLGISEAGPRTIRCAHATHAMTAVQIEYSLWTPEVEGSVLDTCRELGIGFVAYSPLGRGFLTGTVTGREDLREDDARLRMPRFEEDNLHNNLELVAGLRRLAKSEGCTPSQLALAWVLSRSHWIVPRGTTLCQAEHIPMHLGSFIGIIPEILKRHPIETMQPGDVFIGNDAYAGAGTHLPDIVLGEPIFVDGRIVAWAVNTAHHADFADRGHAHIYQEGLRIPPIRLYRAGELQSDVQELILLNCQVPRERLSDLRAQMAANRLGVQRMQALCGKYGTATVLTVGDALQDYADRKMRAGIAALPDGTYRFADTYDNPELGRALPVSVEVTIKGSEMRLHFESPPQVRAGINMIYTALLSSVYYAVKAVVDPTILPNSGLARPITVTAPLGTVNATHPAAVNGRTSTCQRAADLVIGALAQAAPERCIAAGNGACATASFAGADPRDGHLWVYLETIGGGSGARAQKDGLDGVHVHMTNTSNLPVEALEVEYPLTVLRYELVDGSGGAGRLRGGMGLRRVYRAEAECHLRLDGSRLLTAPWGLAGGRPGGCGSFRFGEGVEPFVNGAGSLRAGETIEIVTPGAGGYGPPAARDPAMVERDLADQRIDIATVATSYPGFRRSFG